MGQPSPYSERSGFFSAEIGRLLDTEPYGCLLVGGKAMHYKNGREAKNGDKVVVFPAYGPPMVGILYDAVPNNDYCNGRVAVISVNDPGVNLKEALHFDDVTKALPAEVPDSSKA